MKKAVFAVFASVGLLVSASNAMAASDAGQATANVITPISIANTSDLSFGNGLPGDTLVITQAGAGSGTVLSDKGTHSAAGFDVNGGNVQTYNITHDGPVAMTGTAGTASATLDCPTAGTLNATGADSFACGGSVDLTGTVAGNLSGTFNVTVEYP